MTPILMDTHVLLWLVGGNARLNLAAQQAIDDAAAQNALLVSAITPWEIALLVSKKRINLGMDTQSWMDTALRLPGIRLCPLLPEIAIDSNRLPWEMHPDPADRIVVATARHLSAVLVTADAQILRYGSKGHLRCLPAS